MIFWEHPDDGECVRNNIKDQLKEFDKVSLEYTKRGYSRDTALTVYTLEKFMQIFWDRIIPDEEEEWKKKSE